MTFPFLNSLGFDIFPLTGNIGSHTKFGLRTAGFQDILQHLVVTVRCFDEKLCLMLTVYPLFQFLQSFLTFSRFDRQITVESETLSVEARAHETVLDLVCRLLLEKKKEKQKHRRRSSR